MNNRVRNLDLRLSLPPHLHAQSWQIAEQLRDGFVTRVVERLAERLQAQFGDDAIIEIPLLMLKWDGGEQLIADFDYATRLGDELATDLLSGFDAQSMDCVDLHPGSASSGLRVFRNPAHKAAVLIGATAERQRQLATLANLASLEREWRALCEQGTQALQEGVQFFCETGTAEAVIECLSTSLIEVAVAVCPLSRWPQPIRRIATQRLFETMPEARKDHDRDSPAPPSSSPVNEEPPQVPRDVSESAPPIRASRAELAVDDSAAPVDGAENAVKGELASAQTRPAPKRAKRIPDETLPDLPASKFPGAPASQSNLKTGISDPIANAGVSDPIADTGVSDEFDTGKTGLAGLVYLVNLIMRIELPEILWCCGIDERSFIFDLCLRLAGSDAGNDPVVTAISGIDSETDTYIANAIPQWAAAEVILKIHERLLERLSDSSAVHYTYDDSQIAILVSAPDNAAESWGSLAGIVAQQLAAAFLDLVRADDSQSIDSYLQLDGTVSRSNDETVIRVSMEAIDINVRHAALDVNPSYLQWTGTTLRIDFCAELSPLRSRSIIAGFAKNESND